jgi:hypothetical protein
MGRPKKLTDRAKKSKVEARAIPRMKRTWGTLIERELRSNKEIRLFRRSKKTADAPSSYCMGA